MKKSTFLFLVMCMALLICGNLCVGANEDFVKNEIDFEPLIDENPNSGAPIINVYNGNNSTYMIGGSEKKLAIYNVENNAVIFEADFIPYWNPVYFKASADYSYFLIPYSDSDNNVNYTYVASNYEDTTIVSSYDNFEFISNKHVMYGKNYSDYLAVFKDTDSGRKLGRDYDVYEIFNLKTGTFNGKENNALCRYCWISGLNNSGGIGVICNYEKNFYEYFKIDSEGRYTHTPLFSTYKLLYIKDCIYKNYYTFSTTQYQFADLGIIDVETGKIVVEPQFRSVRVLNDGICHVFVSESLTYKYIDIYGNEVQAPAQSVADSEEPALYVIKENEDQFTTYAVNSVTNETLFKNENRHIGVMGKYNHMLYEVAYNKETNKWQLLGLLKSVPNENQKTQMLFKIDENFVNIYGQYIYNDVAPIIINNRTMLPARIVAENLGATVEWKGDENKVVITKGELVIVLTINSNIAYVNGVAETLDSPAIILNDRTYTPVRYIAERLGSTVTWDGATSTAIITK